MLCQEFIIGHEPVSIIHYTRLGSSIKGPTQNHEATQCHVNWPVVYFESSYKIMDPVSAALPKNLRCNSGLLYQFKSVVEMGFSEINPFLNLKVPVSAVEHWP